MSDKFDSLVIILNRIYTRRRVTPESLCTELERSKRTVHRYIKALITAGFPIEYDRMKRTYGFEEGFTLIKPHLTIEESLAFSLAKKLLGSLGPAMEKSLATIEEKINPGKSKTFKHIVLSPEPVPGDIEKYLAPLHEAIINYRKIELGYKAFGAKEATVNSVHPYYLFFRDGIWYFRGYHEADKGVRTFALDRIESLSILDRYFLPPHLAPEDELSSAFGAFLDGEPVEVVLKFQADYKSLILRKKWHPSQATRELDDGSLEVTFKVNGTNGIRKWIYQWLPFVEVMAPGELRATFRDDLTGALKRHA